MFLSVLTLIFATALFFFFLQSTCHKIVRREFDRPYFRAVVEAGGLQFLAWRQLLEAGGEVMDHSALRTALRCDLTAVTYLLKKSEEGPRSLSAKERLLLLYSRCLFLSLAVRGALGLREKPAALELAALLKYFANLVGQRVHVVKLRDFAPSAAA